MFPMWERAPEDPFRAISVLEKRGQTFVANHRDKVAFSNGFFVLENLPAGDFDLLLKETQTHITIRITQGTKDGKFPPFQRSRLRNSGPQTLTNCRHDSFSRRGYGDPTTKYAPDQTRLHVIATRFLPSFKLFETLGAYSYLDLSAQSLTRPISQYLSGRRIGDEYRYILERRYAAAFPGNMLKQPTLLLNPLEFT